jgi:hypothetical protein
MLWSALLMPANTHRQKAETLLRDTARRAGVCEGKFAVGPSNAPWSKADREWFAAHPDRSHRLRRPFPGEMATLARDGRDERPDDMIIVRQVAVGQRLRFACFGDAPLDDEEYLATAFDLLNEDYNAGRSGLTVTSARIVARRALMAKPSRA